jgi:HlyD family secretion protein
MRNRKRKGVISLVVVLFLLTALYSCSRGPSSEEGKKFVKRVSVALAKRGSVEMVEAYTGEVMAAKKVTLVAKLPGDVGQVLVKERDWVKKGQLLATLDVKELEFQKEQLEATVEMAKLQLKAASKARPEDLKRVKSMYEQAKANYDFVKDQYEKMKSLHEEGGISDLQMEALETQLKAAEEGLKIAEATLEMAKKGAREEAKEIMKEQLKQAEAGLNLLKKKLSDARITAPFNGLVVGKYVEESQTVGPGTPLLTVEDRSYYRVSLELGEAITWKLSVGTRCLVLYHDRTYEGEVTSLSLSASPITKLYHCEVRFSAPPDLLTGGFAEVKFLLGKAEGFVLPKTAIFQRSGRDMVYTVENGEVRATEVRVLGGSSEEVAVEGLKEGAMVVLYPSTVKEGEKVEGEVR